MSLSEIIQTEMKIFENHGEKGKHLLFIYNSLLSIKPTSVEAERAFSSAGFICNPFKSGMSDETLDHTCFLRAYFKKSD